MKLLCRNLGVFLIFGTLSPVWAQTKEAQFSHPADLKKADAEEPEIRPATLIYNADQRKLHEQCARQVVQIYTQIFDPRSGLNAWSFGLRLATPKKNDGLKLSERRGKVSVRPTKLTKLQTKENEKIEKSESAIEKMSSEIGMAIQDAHANVVVESDRSPGQIIRTNFSRINFTTADNRVNAKENARKLCAGELRAEAKVNGMVTTVPVDLQTEMNNLRESMAPLISKLLTFKELASTKVEAEAKPFLTSFINYEKSNPAIATLIESKNSSTAQSTPR